MKQSLRCLIMKGTDVRKIEYRLPAPVITAALMTGHAGLGSSGGTRPTESSIVIKKDGDVRWQPVEAYEAGDYIEEEMTTFLGQRTSDYSSSLGRATSSGNSEGGQKLPMALVLVSLKNGKTYSVTKYDATNHLVESAQEISDCNVTFNALEPGRAAVMGQQMGGVSLLDEEDEMADSAAVLFDGQRTVVKARGPGIVKAGKRVMYVSEGCELRDSSTVKTPEKSTSFTVTNQYLV